MIKIVHLEARKKVGDVSWVSRSKTLMVRNGTEVKEIDQGMFNDLKQLGAEEISLYQLEELAKLATLMKKEQQALEKGVAYDAKKRAAMGY